MIQSTSYVVLGWLSSWKFQMTISLGWVVWSTSCFILGRCLLSAASEPHRLPACSLVIVHQWQTARTESVFEYWLTTGSWFDFSRSHWLHDFYDQSNFWTFLNFFSIFKTCVGSWTRNPVCLLRETACILLCAGWMKSFVCHEQVVFWQPWL